MTSPVLPIRPLCFIISNQGNMFPLCSRSSQMFTKGRFCMCLQTILYHTWQATPLLWITGVIRDPIPSAHIYHPLPIQSFILKISICPCLHLLYIIGSATIWSAVCLMLHTSVSVFLINSSYRTMQLKASFVKAALWIKWINICYHRLQFSLLWTY